jgi:hypothetical protein
MTGIPTWDEAIPQFLDTNEHAPLSNKELQQTRDELKSISADLQQLFKKINWGSSFLGAREITIMNTLQERIDALATRVDQAL